MMKSNGRKHATHKKTHAHRAAKAHSRHSTAIKTPAADVANPTETKPESETIGDESALQTESRTVDSGENKEAGDPNQGGAVS
jgi:hypothetical protein